MEMLGHSQLKLTLDTYSHVLPALQKDAAAQLDKILTRSRVGNRDGYIVVVLTFGLAKNSRVS